VLTLTPPEPEALAGIPCVLFGPGDIEQGAHRPDEWIDLKDLEVAQRVFERLLLGRE
jgi:acetylornithine deacetylase/succinyl-diaminopimelate desuccinylase-like protein